MKTNNNYQDAGGVHNLADWIEGIGKLIKSSGLLIAAIIGAIGAILLACWEFPTHPTPLPPTPVPDVRPIYEPVRPVREDIDPEPTMTQALGVAGTWSDGQGMTLQVSQTGSEVGVNMESIATNASYRYVGSGTMADQTVKLNLDCRTLGIFDVSVGQVPATLTFVNARKAIITFAFFGMPISAELSR